MLKSLLEIAGILFLKKIVCVLQTILLIESLFFLGFDEFIYSFFYSFEKIFVFLKIEHDGIWTYHFFFEHFFAEFFYIHCSIVSFEYSY